MKQFKILQKGDLQEDIVFFTADGREATNAVGTMGEDKNGNLMFFELLGQSSIGDIPCLQAKGKEKYRRLMIQRVYPHIKNTPAL